MGARNKTRFWLTASTTFCLLHTYMVAAFVTNSIDLEASIYPSREFGIVYNVICSVIHFFWASSNWRKLVKTDDSGEPEK